MPTITVDKNDLFNLIGKRVSLETLERYLEWSKGEIKDEAEDEIKIELNDTNRPDLWSPEGIARQIRYKLGIQRKKYALSKTKPSTTYQILVDNSVKEIRPVIGAFAVTGLKITDQFLRQLIQTQEKLCDNYGRKRRSLSIGLYNLDRIKFPVLYRSTKPKDIEFTPLGFSEKMNLDDILEKHPTGQTYRSLLANNKEYPILLDSDQKVLSFPPIINSREVGEVTLESNSIFVEATGDNLYTVALALNIFAYNLFDRGGKILPVTTVYNYKINDSKQHTFPSDLQNCTSLMIEDFEKIAGEELSRSEIIKELSSYGCTVKGSGSKLIVSTESYRNDYLHPVDAIEDFLISRGYDSFEPKSPSCFTVGSLAPITRLSDKVRGIASSLGFEEVFSNVLMSKAEVCSNMLSSAKIAEIDNIMLETYGVLRNSLLPPLLRVEAASQKATYPHRLFEVGEVADRGASDEDDCSAPTLCCLLVAHPKAVFSEIHSYIENLAFGIGIEITLKPATCPSFITGRSGELFVESVKIGTIGEIHPLVLKNWDIKIPIAAAEINLTTILKILHK